MGRLGAGGEKGEGGMELGEKGVFFYHLAVPLHKFFCNFSILSHIP